MKNSAAQRHDPALNSRIFTAPTKLKNCFSNENTLRVRSLVQTVYGVLRGGGTLPELKYDSFSPISSFSLHPAIHLKRFQAFSHSTFCKIET